MDELPDVPALRVLEPPAGGLAALRERLAARPSRRRRWWWLALPAVAAAAIALLLLGRPRHPPVAPVSVLPDPTIDGLYWVASTPGPRRLPPAVLRIEDAPAVAMIELR